MKASCSFATCCFQVDRADLPDLLVPLFNLPEIECVKDTWIGKPLAHQSPEILSFIKDNFSEGWEAEARVGFSSTPPTVLIAVEPETGRLTGFCCWDCTAKGFLGPIGTLEIVRGRGIGKALVLSCLRSMREAGYAYAIIGAAGPVPFFRSICDAREIEGSTPGIYGNPLRFNK